MSAEGKTEKKSSRPVKARCVCAYKGEGSACRAQTAAPDSPADPGHRRRVDGPGVSEHLKDRFELLRGRFMKRLASAAASQTQSREENGSGTSGYPSVSVLTRRCS